MKKNVLFVVDEKKIGGVSTLLSAILNKINISKYNIDILVLHNNGDSLNDIPSDVRIIYGTDFFIGIDSTLKEALKSKNPKKIFSKLSLVLLMKSKKIEKRIVQERKKILDKTYDIEIAFKDGFPALVTAYGDSKKKYHWIHADYSLYDCTGNYRELFKDIIPKFDKIIAISNSVLNIFKKKYVVKDAEVIFNLVDNEKIIKKSQEMDLHFDKKKLNLISVGRIHEAKGYDRLVKVLHQLDMQNKLENVVVRIIGNGPDFMMVESLIHDYGLDNKVLLLGQMDNPFPYIKASDAFLMCSRNEAFGLVIIESLLLKVPVLTLKITSINEIMNDELGLIYENSEEGLLKEIEEVIDNPLKLEKIKDNLKNYDYDIQKIIKQIEDLLDA